MLNKFWRGFVDSLDAQGILGSQRGNHRHAIETMGGDGLQIGLDARTANGVGACDGKNGFHLGLNG